MCEDVAWLGSTHVVKNSRWNSELGAQVCLCRISKVDPLHNTYMQECQASAG